MPKALLMDRTTFFGRQIYISPYDGKRKERAPMDVQRVKPFNFPLSLCKCVSVPCICLFCTQFVSSFRGMFSTSSASGCVSLLFPVGVSHFLFLWVCLSSCRCLTSSSCCVCLASPGVHMYQYIYLSFSLC